jgi:hypothetical protein
MCSTREPGKSFVDVQYNDKMDFGIPESWKKTVPDKVNARARCLEVLKLMLPSYSCTDVTRPPTKGWISFCYCRESDVVERIKARFAGSRAWPEHFNERSGREWVKHMRIRIIQQKLISRFGNSPLSGFQALDRDGGGSLDRTEVAVGLYKLGLWLSPQEVSALMSVLDENNDNDIQYNEWVYFWKLHVDLDTGTLKKDEEVVFPAADSPTEGPGDMARQPSMESDDTDSLSNGREDGGDKTQAVEGGVGDRRGLRLQVSIDVEAGAGVPSPPGGGSAEEVVSSPGARESSSIAGQLGPLPPLA